MELIALSISRTRDKANDAASVSVVKGTEEWDLLEAVEVEAGGVRFEGIVVSKEVYRDRIEYRLASPSILLTRNECDVSLEDEYTIEAAAEAVLPSGFSVKVDCEGYEDFTYSNSMSRGMTIMDVLQDIASSAGMWVYVDGWKVIFSSEKKESSSKSVSVPQDLVVRPDYYTEGGEGLYTKVRGYYYDPDSDSTSMREAAVLSSADYEILDIISADDADREGVKSERDLENFVKKRAGEIKADAFPMRLTILKALDARPLDTLVIGDKEYRVVETSIVVSTQEGNRTEVRCYESA